MSAILTALGYGRRIDSAGARTDTAGHTPAYDKEKAPRMIPAQEALKLLRDGNARFVSDTRSDDSATGSRRRIEMAAQQFPFAIILGCSDSRVPAEIVFDQGLGDLFVIRVAGNIVAPSQIGSVEFAAERYGTRLVVVLGHSSCGAIIATLEELGRNSREQSPESAQHRQSRAAFGPAAALDLAGQ